MTERKPPLHRGPSPVDDDPDAPPTEEEIAESQRLRDALEDPSVDHEGADLARALRSAYGPEPLAHDELASLVEASLDPAEVASAQALRDSLEEPNIPNDDASFAVALAAAWAPKALSDADHAAIVAKAIASFGRKAEVARLDLRRERIVRVTFVTSMVAIAASILLLVRTKPTEAEAPLAKARSTQPLFAEPFKPGEASARIDRIAVARASDYRDNRFAKWGVR